MGLSAIVLVAGCPVVRGLGMVLSAIVGTVVGRSGGALMSPLDPLGLTDSPGAAAPLCVSGG